MYYHVKRAKSKETAILTSLFIVTSKLGARIVERKSMNSPWLGHLPYGKPFQGSYSGAWVRVLGGGYCLALTVREVK